MWLVSATDPDGDTLTYSATGLPQGLAINPATGAITGTLTYTSAGTASVTVTVSDGTLSANTSFTWTVSNVDRPPVVTAIANQTSAEHDTISLAVSASDPDGDALTYSATGLPQGLAINPATGAITGTLTYTSAGTASVTITVSDATLSATTSFTWTVTQRQSAAGRDRDCQSDERRARHDQPGGDRDGSRRRHVDLQRDGIAARPCDQPGDRRDHGDADLLTSAGTASVTVTVSDRTLSANTSFTWTVSNVRSAAGGIDRDCQSDERRARHDQPGGERDEIPTATR